MKIAVVTDSTAYLPRDLRTSLGIHMIPLAVTIDEQVYEEEVDLCMNDFYDKVRGDGALPKTSQPPIGTFVSLFESLRDEGYTDIISIHLSSGISGTYNGAVQAGDMVEGVNVHAFDSEISCYVQGFFAIRAAERANEGVDVETILDELEQMRPSLHAYFMVDDLSHLQRGGRLSGAQAFVGSLLCVKPILHFENKVIVPYEKIRTRKKAMKRIADLLGEAAEDGPLDAVIIHGNREEEAIEWKEELEARYPDVHFAMSYFGAVIGTHLGEGAMGLGWVKRKR